MARALVHLPTAASATRPFPKPDQQKVIRPMIPIVFGERGYNLRTNRIAPMALAPGTRLGPYEILGPAGAGGMGEVYRARDSRLDRDVAIKILPEHLSATPG